MIVRFIVQKVHDREPRQRKKCGTCGRRRLCTRETLSVEGETETFDEWTCNGCMTMTPPWPRGWGGSTHGKDR